MTMMDTRVGAPGADVPDDDLDFAVAVKLRLDRGEDVPDEDLDRAVAIKLRLGGGKPAREPDIGLPEFPGEIPPSWTPPTLTDQAAADLAHAAPAIAAPPPPGWKAPGSAEATPTMLGEAADVLQALRDPRTGILAPRDGSGQSMVGSLASGIVRGSGALVGAGGGVLRAAGQGLQELGLPGGPTVAGAGRAVEEVARTQEGLYPADPARPISGGVGETIPGMAAALVAGPAGSAVFGAQGAGQAYSRTLEATGSPQTALGAAGVSGLVNALVAPAQIAAVRGVTPGLANVLAARVNGAVGRYLAGAGADLSVGAIANVAQLAAEDTIDTVSGANPDAFQDFDRHAAVAAVVGATLSGYGAHRAGMETARAGMAPAAPSADVQQAQALAKQMAEGQNLPYPAVQQRVEGPPAPVQGTSLRTPPPPAEAGPAAATSSAAGNPDQPTARDPGAPAGGDDPYAAIDALRARMAGPPPAEQTSSTTNLGRPVPPAETQAEPAPAAPQGQISGDPTSSTTPPPPPGRQYPQRAPQRPAAPGPRPDLGSSRLNIPLSPEMEAERAQQTVQQNVSAWQREKANRDRLVPLPKVESDAGAEMNQSNSDQPLQSIVNEGWSEGPMSQPYRRHAYATVGQAEAARLSDATGLDLTGYQHVIGTDDVRKIFKTHGNPAAEQARGNLPLTAADVAKIPDIVANPDSSQAGDTSRQGLETIVHTKRVNGHVYVVEEVRVGKQQLAPKTMYKTKVAPEVSGRGRPHVPEGPEVIRPERSPGPDAPKLPETDAADNPQAGPESSPATTQTPPHPAASDQRERVHQEVRAAFGEQGAEALPLLDAYARSWTAATGKPAGEFYGRFSFEKGGDTGKKGSYRLLEDGRAIIRALNNPDASTLPHELGHAFLDFLHEIDPKLHADAMKALGAAGETPTVENHERWSRAFEAYLREGKAPTSLLRATFEKFKSWLRDIYRTISRGPLAKKLTPALRQVFDQMLSRGDQPSEPAPTKTREIGKRRTAPVERREWSKADIADRIQRKYESSPSYDADLSQEHVEGDMGGFTRFSGKIPGELRSELEGRPDLLKMLQADAPAGTAGGADALAQLGAEGYVRRLTRWQQGQTKDTIAKLRRNSADPEAAFLADLWESTPKGGGKPKETVKAEDLAERGLRFTIDDRPASIIQKSGDLYLRVKDLGTYPLVAFDEVPVDKGSLAKGAGGKEMYQAAQDDRRDPTPPTPPTSKLVDVAAYLATNQARLKRRGGGRVDNRTAAAALDRFLGHGKYGSELPEKVRGMANRMLARSLNKYGFTDPAALEARVGKAFRAAEIADRRAARPSRLQKALDQANGVRPEPTTQDAVDRAVAIERAHAEVGTAMQVRKAELAGEKKVAKLKDLLSEKGLQAAREMAAERRAARQQLIDQADRFRVKYLKAKLGGEEAGSKTGYKAGQADLQAMREEAADLVLKGLPRGERGRSSILKAIRNATRQRDVYRLMEEVQHRAVSARAGEAWKQIRKLTRRKNLSALPEKAEDILGIADGENVREGVRKLLAQAKAAQETAKYQRAEPIRLARLINRRAAERAIFKDPTSTPLQKALARDTIRSINEKIRNERPDLQPKVDAARRLGEIENEIRETTTKVKNADAMWISNERRAARGMRKFMETRIQAAPKLSIVSETKPGVPEKVRQTKATQAVFASWTPDTLGQWVDNAIGHPEQAQFGHHLLFKEPLRAAGDVAQEKVARLAALEELAKRHGFESWDHATAAISGTHGGGLQETVPIDVPGWVDKKITLGEALKIFGDNQDPQTSDLSDEGMAHRLDRQYKHAAALDRPTRAAIIDAIPQRYRDFYTEFKELKEKMLGGRALELRRRYRGTAPETIPMREPRLRQGDSDYITDYFESGSQSRSLMEQSFMRDRVHSPGPVNLIVDGLESHMRDWDSQLHLIHHADLAYALSKTLLHKDIVSAIGERGGKQAERRIHAYIDRILGTEVKTEPTAVDKVAKLLRKNVGAAMTSLSPRSFVKQFSVIPMLGAMYPKEMMAASSKIGQKGLRERIMLSNGLLAQRFHMADAAKAASAGMSNPIFDSGDFKLRVKAGVANLRDAATQVRSGQLRNATKNTLRALGNFRDSTTNLLRFNSWADEQGVKAAFLITEQLVDREHPNLNPADRERMIGLKTAELVHRTMNTYDTLGQSFWRSDLDQKGAAGLLNMFSNDSTKQSNLLYQAVASGDKALAARITGGLALSAAWSVMAPAALTLIPAAIWRHYVGGSESDKERERNLRLSLGSSAARELVGKIPVPWADLLADVGREIASGKGDVGSATSPVTQTLSALMKQPALALYNTWSAEDDEDKSEIANYEAKRRKAELAAAAMQSSLRSGATLAGVGAMPVITMLRAMKPQSEPYGLAANWARRGDEDKAAEILADEAEKMRKAGLEDRDIKEHLITVVRSKLNRDVEKDDKAERLDNERMARRVVSAALSR